MAVFLNNTVGLKIGSVDLSDHVKSITLNQKFDELEVSAMGDFSHRYVKGLESNSLTVSFLNDTATTPTASVLSTLESTYGTSATFKIVQTQSAGSATVSATNKLYSGTILINNLTPVNGAVGDISTQDITFTINSVLTVSDSGTW
jgi:hypothetical protein